MNWRMDHMAPGAKTLDPLNVTERLARFALEFSLEAAPSVIKDKAKLRILDTLGVALAGSQQDCARIANQTDIELGSGGNATIIGKKRRSSCLQAAFLNGISSHALEFDDMTSSVITHTSATVLPSVLSLAEHVGASGSDLLAAYIVSFEISSRIGWGMKHNLLPRGWHPNGVLAGIGAAAGGARLLKSNVDQTRMAIGIAASCSAGLRKNVGSMTKPFHMGHAALNGVLAATLAKNGYTADQSIFEQSPSSLASVPSTAHLGHGHFSFPEVFAGTGGYDLSMVVDNIGEVYELGTDSTITRFHPGSTFPQAAVDETIAIVTANDVSPSSIKSIRVGVTPMCLSIAPYGKPSDGVFARFSAPYAIAVAAIDREVTIRQYTDERVNRSDVQSLIDRVSLYVPDDFKDVTQIWSSTPPTPVSCRVEIMTVDGSIHRGYRDTTNGYPGSETKLADVRTKFMECADSVISSNNVTGIIDMISDIEKLDSVDKMTSLLS